MADTRQGAQGLCSTPWGSCRCICEWGLEASLPESCNKVNHTCSAVHLLPKMFSTMLCHAACHDCKRSLECRPAVELCSGADLTKAPMCCVFWASGEPSILAAGDPVGMSSMALWHLLVFAQLTEVLRRSLGNSLRLTSLHLRVGAQCCTSSPGSSDLPHTGMFICSQAFSVSCCAILLAMAARAAQAAA